MVDLKTVTVVCHFRTLQINASKLVLESQDNRDAEAFLKPVSRAEVPDYYDGTYLWFRSGLILTVAL